MLIASYQSSVGHARARIELPNACPQSPRNLNLSKGDNFCGYLDARFASARMLNLPFSIALMNAFLLILDLCTPVFKYYP